MDILAVQKHRAALGRMNPGQAVQQGGFSAAVGAHDGGDLGRWQMKAQILRHNKLTVRQSDVVGGKGRGLGLAHVRLRGEGLSSIQSR